MLRLDLSGEIYGNLTVLGSPARERWGRLNWHCQCVCGRQVMVSSNNLRSGNTKSCGCLKAANTGRRLNLLGHRFGRLTVMSYDNTINGRARWLCECDCGNKHVASATKLRRGTVSSCGCLVQHMRARKRAGHVTWAKTIKGAQGECVKCGSDTSLHAHHVISVSANPALSRDFSNGAALCEDCHREFHVRYGKNVGVDQFCEWLGLSKLATATLQSFVGHRQKGKGQDLRKAIHCLDLLLELEYPS